MVFIISPTDAGREAGEQPHCDECERDLGLRIALTSCADEYEACLLIFDLLITKEGGAAATERDATVPRGSRNVYSVLLSSCLAVAVDAGGERVMGRLRDSNVITFRFFALARFDLRCRKSELRSTV